MDPSSAAVAQEEQPSMPSDDRWDKTKFENTINEGDRYTALLKWLEDNGSYFSKLRLVSYTENVRGIHSSEVINPNETIMIIPRELLITVEMGKALPLGEKLEAHGCQPYAGTHIFLQLFLMLDSENPDSRFRPYYDTLPKELSGIPLFWEERELDYLKGSYLQNQITEKKLEIRRDYDMICEVDPSFSRFSIEYFNWARMIVSSRNFTITIDGQSTAALVPLADMLNHLRPRETTWEYIDSYRGFVISSLTEIASGDQIYDSYGVKCNYRFLLNYGFAIEKNIEADGHSPNEIFATFRLCKDDPLFESKRRLILLCGYGCTFNTRVTSYFGDKSTETLLRYISLRQRATPPSLGFP